IKSLFGDKTAYKPEDYEQLLRIAEELKALTPEELALYQFLAQAVTHDLNVLEKSIKIFKQLLPYLKTIESAKPTTAESPTLLDKRIEQILSQVNPEDFKTWSPEKKKDMAIRLAYEVTVAQLRDMLKLDTISQMVVGMVDVYHPSVEAGKELSAAFDVSTSSTKHAAHVAGFVSKTAGLAVA